MTKNNKFFLIFLIVFSWNLKAYLSPFKSYYSQLGQDKYLIEKVFKFKRNGFFFDIGSHDGISYSNTYYLENKLGWNGICIEPHEQNFKLLEKNRRCVCLNGCIADTTGEKDFLKVNGPSEMLSGLLETYDKKHLERVNLELQQLGGSKEIIKIKTFNFNEICEKFKIKHIDLLCIDTEGSELQILKSIEFRKINISFIMVENNFNERKIRHFLQKRHYKFIHSIGPDEIYKKIK